MWYEGWLPYHTSPVSTQFWVIIVPFDLSQHRVWTSVPLLLLAIQWSGSDNGPSWTWTSSKLVTAQCILLPLQLITCGGFTQKALKWATADHVGNDYESQQGSLCEMRKTARLYGNWPPHMAWVDVHVTECSIWASRRDQKLPMEHHWLPFIQCYIVNIFTNTKGDSRDETERMPHDYLKKLKCFE